MLDCENNRRDPSDEASLLDSKRRGSGSFRSPSLKAKRETLPYTEIAAAH